MKRLGTLLLPSVVMLGVTGILFWPAPTLAGLPNTMTNNDYSATPPFVTSAVTPNVLIILDNSGSMGRRVQCVAAAGDDFSTCPTFDQTFSYGGMFDPMTCYTYNTTDTRFDADTTAGVNPKAAVSTACPSTDWDGNFLNWVTLRRIDMAKIALIGGSCAVARAADGTCPASGSAPMITLKGQTKAIHSGSIVSTPAVPTNTTGIGATNTAYGRVPTSVQTLGSSPSSLFFHLPGETSSLVGSFCVDNDATPPPMDSTSCALNTTNQSDSQNTSSTADSDSFTEQRFVIRVSVASQPQGVIQGAGSSIRFGLMEFLGDNDLGGQVLVPIGSSQYVALFSTSLTATYANNTVAMIAAIEATYNGGDTPMAETLYDAARYVAQVNSAYYPSQYVYPLAFSPGVNLGSTGAGSLGSGELSALTGSEPCPAGYIGTNAGNCAAGRDPFFFGSNATPAWANPSATVSCCQVFVVLFTDGDSQVDTNVPSALQDYAHAVHGQHCTGYTTTIHLNTAPGGTCNSNLATPNSYLLAEHKTDYGNSGTHYLDDVALWAHTTDLRKATIAVINEAGHDLPGFQNITLYGFYAFGGVINREYLMQASKQGGFDDSNGNNLPDLQSEWDRVDNLTGLLVPDGIPDTFFESNDVLQMKDRLFAALTSILQKAASGTSVSVLASSSTGEGAIYQAFFFPKTFVPLPNGALNQVGWTGFAQGLFIDKFGNIREDSSQPGCTGPPDGQLVLIHDCIIRIRLETDTENPNYNNVVIDRYKDDNGDGLPDTSTPFQTTTIRNGGVSNVQPVWEGGRRLALLSPGASCEGSNTWPQSGNMSQGGNTCRRVLTWADIDNNGLVGGTERLEFKASNAATFCPYLGGKAVIYCNSANTAAITAADITADPNLTGCLGLTRTTCAQNEATNIINWIRGSSVSGLRDRTFNVLNDSGATVQAQWKLGDVVDAAPVIVGAPSTRYDIIYGDQTYAQYFQRYKDRRQVAYVGANDGMLHAFNAGFFSNDDRKIDGSGPTVQVRFTTLPKRLGTSTTCPGAALPCDASVATYSVRADAPPLGAELWAFIPQDLLPQLRWLTLPTYDHVYYMDLTPKVTDARIFPADADHPGGWGTILIGGFRLGGSCSYCTGKGAPRVVQADFNNNGTTTDTGNSTSGSDYRIFLSSYFVLDITNPEKEPNLLWVFRDDDLGLTTAEPAVLRVNPSTDAMTSSTNEKWYVVFGTGPTYLDAITAHSAQNAQIFVVDLKLGPTYIDVNKANGSAKLKGKKTGQPCPTSLPCMSADTSVASGALRVFDSGVTGAFMADAVTVDYDLDFRVDAIYAGSVICNSNSIQTTGCNGSNPVWKGAMWRLTTNGGDINPDNWGITSGGGQILTSLISTFAYSTPKASTCTNNSPCNVGPITTAPTLTQDDTHNLWLFFGTGRYYASGDKSNVDIQHFFGVKDCILTGGCTDQTAQRNNLYNSSNVVTCSSCASGTNVSTTGSTTSFNSDTIHDFGSLVNNIQNMDGWFTTFNDPTAPLQTPPRAAMTPGERNLASATLLGGTVFFTSFIPSTDMCQATGTGQLYAVYYLTGGPYTSSSIGSAASGSNTLMSKSLSLGQGLPTQMQLHIGAELPLTPAGPTTPGDCAGSRVIGITQTSTGAAPITCVKPAKSFYSRMLTWRDL